MLIGLAPSGSSARGIHFLVFCRISCLPVLTPWCTAPFSTFRAITTIYCSAPASPSLSNSSCFPPRGVIVITFKLTSITLDNLLYQDHSLNHVSNVSFAIQSRLKVSMSSARKLYARARFTKYLDMWWGLPLMHHLHP